MFFFPAGCYLAARSSGTKTKRKRSCCFGFKLLILLLLLLLLWFVFLYIASFCFCTLHLLCIRERKTKPSFFWGGGWFKMHDTLLIIVEAMLKSMSRLCFHLQAV